MKTLVELFDQDPMKNVLATYCFRPHRLILIGEADIMDSTARQTLSRLFSFWNIPVQIRYVPILPDNPSDIFRALRQTVREEPDAVFELSGGRDLPLCCTGAFCLRENRACFYLDSASGKLLSLHSCDGLAKVFSMPKLHVKDLLLAAGAKIGGYGHFVPDLQDKVMCERILKVFELVLDNLKSWGGLVNYLQTVTHLQEGREDALSFTARKIIRTDTGLVRWNPTLFHALHRIGVYRSFREERDTISFTYCDVATKKCMMVHGFWLELSTYVRLLRTGFFDSVKTSVVIDWDGSERPSSFTKNEVDLILMKNCIPVFVSCKMGTPSPQALYEIRLLASRFGGENAKAVLLSAAPVKRDNPALAMRASDAGVTLFDLDDLNSDSIEQKFMDLFSMRTRQAERGLGTGFKVLPTH